MLARGQLLMLLVAVVCLWTSSAGHDTDQSLTAPSTSISSLDCLHSPSLQGDDSALINPRGHVTVVTLIQANSAYSRRQAQKLNNVCNRIKTSAAAAAAATAASGETAAAVGDGVDVHVIGINSRNFMAVQMVNELAGLVNFTVYQSTHQHDHWSRLGGYKDDVFVYDRCGNLAYYVPFPRSYVPYRFVEAAILSTLYDNPCATCQTTSMPSSNCTNSTVNSQASTGTTEANAVDSCAAYSKQRCANLHNRVGQAVGEWRLAARCCRRYRPQHGSNQTASGQHHHHHHAANRRCLCLPTSSNTVQHSCLCRSNVTSSPSCYCTLTSDLFIRHCTSCRNEDWPTSGDTASTCSCHINQRTIPADQCSCDERPVPYGRHAGLSSTNSDFCRQTGRPLLCPQASCDCPVSSGELNTTVSCSCQMELASDSSLLRPSPVSCSCAKHQGQQVQAVSGKSCSCPEQKMGDGSVSGLNVFGCQCKEGVSRCSSQMQCDISPDRSDCSCQGCLVKISKSDCSGDTSAACSTSSCQQSCQQVTCSCDNADARTKLCQQQGQAIDCQLSECREIDGCHCNVINGTEKNATAGCSGSQNGCVNVCGCKCGNALNLVRESCNAGTTSGSCQNGQQCCSTGACASCSASSCQQSCQMMKCSCDNTEARSRLCQQQGQAINCQQSECKEMDGCHCSQVSGSGKNATEGCSSGSQTGCMNVCGCKCGNSMSLVRESCNEGTASGSCQNGQQCCSTGACASCSASSCQQSCQMMKCSCDNTEARSRLCQRQGQAVNCQQSDCREIDGCQCSVINGSEETAHVGCPNGRQTSCSNVCGCKCGSSFAVSTCL